VTVKRSTTTGGGAFLEFVEGKTLPAVAVLEERARAAPRRNTPVHAGAREL
jgi:hypothetical protein